MSAIEIKPRTSIGTHNLDGISQWHVSHQNQVQNINWHSQPEWDFTLACQPLKSSSEHNWHSHTEWDFTVACQPLKSSPEHQLALTPWMGFHSGMSATDVEPRELMGTHFLDVILINHIMGYILQLVSYLL